MPIGWMPRFSSMQLEVADRLAAQPGSREYGYLSAIVQFYAQVKSMLRIPPGAFRPPPKVQSALVALASSRRTQAPRHRGRTWIREFLKVCFAHKRKTLRNNLRAIVTQEEAGAALQESGIAANTRAEQIGLPQFARLFSAVGTLRNELQPLRSKFQKLAE